MFLRRVRRRIDQLPQDTGPHRLTVEAFFPIVELRDVAGAAGARVERGFEQTQSGVGRSLSAERPSPIFFEEAFNSIGLLSWYGLLGEFGSFIAAWQANKNPSNKTETADEFASLCSIKHARHVHGARCSCGEGVSAIIASIDRRIPLCHDSGACFPRSSFQLAPGVVLVSGTMSPNLR